jgi:flagellar motor switch protein FliG
MSTRAAQMLDDEISGLGPMRLSAVEEARAELVKAAFALAEQGRITIVGPADRML